MTATNDFRIFLFFIHHCKALSTEKYKRYKFFFIIIITPLCVLGQQLVERTRQGKHVWNELPLIIDQNPEKTVAQFYFRALALQVL